jgi:hypothetical protein
MLTLLARGGLPGLRVGLEHAHGALVDGPGGPGGLACCCDAGRSRSSAAVAVAGAAAAAPSSRPRRAPAPSAPPRRHSTAACEPSSSARRSRPIPSRCAAGRPARAQPVVAGRSWAWRLQRSTRYCAGAARAGQRVDPKLLQPRSATCAEQPVAVMGCLGAAASQGRTATTPERTRFPAWALQRHLVSADAAGRGWMPARWEVQPLWGRVW